MTDFAFYLFVILLVIMILVVVQLQLELQSSILYYYYYPNYYCKVTKYELTCNTYCGFSAYHEIFLCNCVIKLHFENNSAITMMCNNSRNSEKCIGLLYLKAKSQNNV
jgi:hypothetical protein